MPVRKRVSEFYNAESLKSQFIFLLAIILLPEITFACIASTVPTVLLSRLQVSSCFIADFPPSCYFITHSGNRKWTFNHAVTDDLYIYIAFLQFLGAFAKLIKATISFVMFVRPSAWNNSAPTGRILMKFDI